MKLFKGACSASAEGGAPSPDMSPEGLQQNMAEDYTQTTSPLTRLNEELLQNMAEDYTGVNQKEIIGVRRGLITREAFLAVAARHVERVYGDRSREEGRGEALKAFEQYIGYYKLQELLDDREVSDIRIVGAGCVRCKRRGRRYTSGVRFSSDREYARFVACGKGRGRADGLGESAGGAGF